MYVPRDAPGIRRTPKPFPPGHAFDGEAVGASRRRISADLRRAWGGSRMTVAHIEALTALWRAATNWCPVCRGNGSLRGPTTTKCPNCHVLLLRAKDAIDTLSGGAAPSP